jgi:hypothetical protein
MLISRKQIDVPRYSHPEPAIYRRIVTLIGQKEDIKFDITALGQ